MGVDKDWLVVVWWDPSPSLVCILSWSWGGCERNRISTSAVPTSLPDRNFRAAAAACIQHSYPNSDISVLINCLFYTNTHQASSTIAPSFPHQDQPLYYAVPLGIFNIRILPYLSRISPSAYGLSCVTSYAVATRYYGGIRYIRSMVGVPYHIMDWLSLAMAMLREYYRRECMEAVLRT